MGKPKPEPVTRQQPTVLKDVVMWACPGCDGRVSVPRDDEVLGALLAGAEVTFNCPHCSVRFSLRHVPHEVVQRSLFEE